MDAELMNISKIETFFNDLLDNNVSENTFFSDLPKSINQKWKDMVVVDCDDIRDLNAFGSGNVYVFLYAKTMSDGTKPVKTLSMLETNLNECIKSNKDEHYKISRARSYSDFDEQRNLYVNVVILNLIII